MTHKFEHKTIQTTQAAKTKLAIFDDEKVIKTPILEKAIGVEKSKSFSKFKDAFEDGVGLMNDSEDYHVDKLRVNAELRALKLSSKIQKMFRINKSQSNPHQSPKFDHVCLNDDTKKDVQR